MRPPEVDLPLTEQKCAPRGHCSQATVCARWLIPATPGRPIGDLTLSPLFVQGKCPKHLLASEHRKRAAGVAPRVHEAPGGIFRG